MFFHRLLYLILAFWAARVLRGLASRGPGRKVSDFAPRDGGPHPSGAATDRRAGRFGPDDIVDGEFEDVPTPPRP
jgi:hypothetical protein